MTTCGERRRDNEAVPPGQAVLFFNSEGLPRDGGIERRAAVRHEITDEALQLVEGNLRKFLPADPVDLIQNLGAYDQNPGFDQSAEPFPRLLVLGRFADRKSTRLGERV